MGNFLSFFGSLEKSLDPTTVNDTTHLLFRNMRHGMRRMDNIFFNKYEALPSPSTGLLLCLFTPN
jgi:hypothetical protein